MKVLPVAPHLLLLSAPTLFLVFALPAPAPLHIDVRSTTLSNLEVRADFFEFASRGKDDKKQQVEQQIKDKAKDKAEDKAKDVAIKTGVKVGAKIAASVTGAAIPGVGEIVEVAQMVESVVELVVGAIKHALAEDRAKDEKFTNDIVSQAFAKNGKWNYLAINEKLKQSVKMQGTEGKDWGVTERKIKGHFATMKYYFYHFQEGTVENKGDGGYLNWAFIGTFQRFGKDGKPDPNGHLVKFTKH